MNNAKMKLILGDAADPRHYPPFQSVDLVLMDPPFVPKIHRFEQRNRHKNKTTGKWEKPAHILEAIPTPPLAEYPAFWGSVLWECVKCLKPSGWLIFKCDDVTFGELYAPTQRVLDFFKKIIWDKGMIGIGMGVRNQHENLAVFRPYDCEGSYFGDRKGFSSVMDCANFNRGKFGRLKQQEHINQTPTAIWKPLIAQFCPPAGSILDCFMGSGSVGKASQELNKHTGNARAYWGIELQPQFFKIAKAQLEPETALTPYIGHQPKCEEKMP